MAAKLVVASDSIAMGGEVKFQKFSNWDFDYKTNVMDTKLHRPKTIETYKMPRIPDKRWWFDFYFIIGAYAMCGNGLLRDDKQIKPGLEYYVFPTLHKYS